MYMKCFKFRGKDALSIYNAKIIHGARAVQGGGDGRVLATGLMY